MIKNADYFRSRIMTEKRNSFLYAKNGKEREDFLKSCVTSFPIKLDSVDPIGFYISDEGLIKLPRSLDNYDGIAIDVFHQRYIDFLITSKIMDSTIEQVGASQLQKSSSEFLQSYRKKLPISDLEEFRDILLDRKELYKEEFSKYAKTGEMVDFTQDLEISHIYLPFFLTSFKRMINSQSYLTILFDQQTKMSLKTQQAIIDLMGFKQHSDLSTKIACEPNEWSSYYGSNNSFIQSIHDYTTYDLDGIHDRHIKFLIRQRNIKH